MKNYYDGKWLIFGDKVSKEVDLVNCGNTINGVCEKVKNISECIQSCENSENCKFGYYIDPKRERVGRNWDKLTHQEKQEIVKQLDREFEQLPEGTGFGDYVDDIVNQFIYKRKMK